MKLLVTQMKSSKRRIYSNMEFKKTPCVEWIPFAFGCNFGDEGDDNNTAKTISRSINVDNIEMEGTGTVSSVRACDTDVSHQNRTDDLDLVKTPN